MLYFPERFPGEHGAIEIYQAVSRFEARFGGREIRVDIEDNRVVPQIEITLGHLPIFLAIGIFRAKHETANKHSIINVHAVSCREKRERNFIKALLPFYEGVKSNLLLFFLFQPHGLVRNMRLFQGWSAAHNQGQGSKK